MCKYLLAISRTLAVLFISAAVSIFTTFGQNNPSFDLKLSSEKIDSFSLTQSTKLEEVDFVDVSESFEIDSTEISVPTNEDTIMSPELGEPVSVPVVTQGVLDLEAIKPDKLELLTPPARGRIEPSYKIAKARHVANGVAMRNRTSGTIHLRGVPNGRRVISALLYWNVLDNAFFGSNTFPVLFNGNRVTGIKTADSPDPCWFGVIGSHSYVANVTQFVNASGHPNQDYDVVIQFDELTSTTGQNPWSPVEFQDVRVEGAGLIVIYEDPFSGPVYVYDDLSNSMFFSNATFGLGHDLHRGTALFTMFGADGQRGSGHNNFVTNERTFFNLGQIAGNPVTNSDWDGSDGWPLPQLWDTHTHLVSLVLNTATVQYQAGGDCLVPVAFVIDVN